MLLKKFAAISKQCSRRWGANGTLPRRIRLGLTWIVGLLAGCLVVLLGASCQALGEPLSLATSPVPVVSSVEAALPVLQAADVIYLGEQHDRAADHAAQLALVQALQANHPRLAIAFEMFQHPFQPALDRYLAGEIDEAELIAESEYEQRWGFPWEFYAPLLRFARAEGLPAIALNAPTEVTRQVAGQGLDSLDATARAQIPPLAEIDTSNAAYRRLLQAAFSAHAAHGGLELENFIAAQVVWDETMAAQLAEFHRAQPDYQIVVIAGRGHAIYGYGIPDRVARRLGPELQQAIVLLNPPADLEERDGRAPGDLIWRSP